MTRKKIDKTDDEWRQTLTDEQYWIARQGGTEPAFTGRFYRHKADGSYHCVCCDAQLFASDAKYDSGSGWPSFWQAVDKAAIREVEDRSHGMARIEVRCAKCDAHLGHLFSDGPAPSGMRYCINSASLDFSDAEDSQA